MHSVVFNSKIKTSANTQNFSTINNGGGSANKMLKYQQIAPAPLQSTQNFDNDKLLTRKYTPRALNAPYSVDQTQSVQRRNARERNRVKQVNNSFAKLRQHIPQTIIADLTKGGGRGPQKKISKVDTLRIAVEYIRRLQDLVEDRSTTGGSYSGNSANNLLVDTLSNISFSSATSRSSSSSSLAGSPPPMAGNATSYYAQNTSPALPSYQQQFSSASSSLLLTPVSLNSYSQTHDQLDTGCASPTSSFNSSMSFDSGTFEPAAHQLADSKLCKNSLNNSNTTSNNNNNNNNNNTNNSHLNAHLQLKFEPYDNFQLQEEDCQPDDEEILDYISLWQEQ